jgi:hypothetical protein
MCPLLTLTLFQNVLGASTGRFNNASYKQKEFFAVGSKP